VPPLNTPMDAMPAPRVRPLSLSMLVAIIYYSVCGGPFGSEEVVRAAGPFLALLGFLIMPMVWSVPEALVAAELSTAFPNNSGYVTWVTAAYGPRWGFLEGFLSWLCGVTDNAVYPVLFQAYLERLWPEIRSGTAGLVFVMGFSLVLSFCNYRGLGHVGLSALALAIFTMLPFMYIVPVGLPKIEFDNLFIMPELSDIHWSTYFNVLFWNLNYWDTASTLAGEVQNPRKIFPLALLLSMLLVWLSYFMPLLVGVGMDGKNYENWHAGFLAELGRRTGGSLVQQWVVAAAAVSCIGQFVSEQAANAFQLQGMAEMGWLPMCFAQRSAHGTPTCGLLVGVVVILWMCTYNFERLVTLINGVYCIAQLLEFAAFLELRRNHPSLRRPYCVPLKSTLSCVALLTPAMIFCVGILLMPIFQGNWVQAVFFVGAPVVGLLLEHMFSLCRKNGCMQFSRSPPAGLDDVLGMQTPRLSSCSDVEHWLTNSMKEVSLGPPLIAADSALGEPLIRTSSINL